MVLPLRLRRTIHRIARLRSSFWTLVLAVVALMIHAHSGVFRSQPTVAAVTAKDLEGLSSLSPAIHAFVSRCYFPLRALGSRLTQEELALYGHHLGHTPFHSQHDPRLMPSLWLDALPSNGSRSLRLPFSWASWIDTSNNGGNLTCGEFRTRFHVGHPLDRCVDHSGRATFTNFVSEALSEPARRYVGTLYMLRHAPPPERVMFLGVDLVRAVVVPVLGAVEPEADLRLLTAQYLSRRLNPFKAALSGVAPTEVRKGAIDAIKGMGSTLNPLRDEFRVIGPQPQEPGPVLPPLETPMPEVLTLADFTTNVVNLMTDLRASVRLTNDPTTLDARLLASLSNHTPMQNFTKHFHEARLTKGGGSHFDWRFFQHTRLLDYERQAALHRMTRAWLRFSAAAGLQSWLAHGTLLGWYWNGLNMPWDGDVDVQLTLASLYRLAREYNQTVVVDVTPGNLSHPVGSYLIDVGPSFFSRIHTNGLNTIDARFIDTHTGLYVDITALAVTNTSRTLTSRRGMRELNELFDPGYRGRESTARHDPAYQRELLETHTRLEDSQELLNCRNNHFYSLDELSPLVPTLFEGVRAYVPRGHACILQREYRHGLTNLEFDRYQFKPVYRLWFPRSVCPHDRTGAETCADSLRLLRNADTRVEVALTKAYVSNHWNQREAIRSANYIKPFMVNSGATSGDFPPLSYRTHPYESFRVDPWMINRVKATRALQL